MGFQMNGNGLAHRIAQVCTEAGDGARRTIRRQPVKAVAAGLAVGVALGMFPAVRRTLLRSVAWIVRR